MGIRRFAFFLLFMLFLQPFQARAWEAPWESIDLSLLSGFDLGLGGSLTTSEYKDMHGVGYALPLIGYEGEWLYLRGVAGGFHFFKNEMLELNAQLSYMPQHFYAGDSDSWAMRRLDNRYSTLMGGFNGRLALPFGLLALTASTDLLGYSGGSLIDASYTCPLKLGMVDLAPSLGAQWTDANYNRYYYGVDHGEAKASGLSHYDPGGAISPYAMLTARVNFSENWSAFASGRALFLNREIYESPMVDKAEKYSLSLGLMYGF